MFAGTESQWWLWMSIYPPDLCLSVGTVFISHAQSVASVMSNSLWPLDCSPPAPLSMGFSMQEYWSGLPCPPPADPLDSGIKPMSLVSPAMQETCVSSLDWEDPLEKDMLLQYTSLENPIDREAWQATVHGVSKSWTRLNDEQFISRCYHNRVFDGLIICWKRKSLNTYSWKSDLGCAILQHWSLKWG